MLRSKILAIGRLPPPIDGQSLLTRRLIQMLSEHFDISTVNTTVVPGSTSLNKVAHYGIGKGKISSLSKEVKPDAVVWTTISPHAVSHLRDRLTILGSLNRNTPVIAVVHWGNFDRLFTSALTRKSGLKLIRRLDKIVFNDELLASKCRKWIPENKILVIPNAIAEECICTDLEVRNKQKEHPLSPFRVLYLSNMIQSKGYLDVLKAGKLVRDAGHSILIDFAGSWHDKPDKFLDLADELNMQDNIVHHGLVTNRSEVKSLHLSADAFVLPTYYPTEAQPSAIIEAMSAGTPVVTCDQGGISHMIQPGIEGLFVPKQSPGKIAEALISIQGGQTWKRFSTNARNRFLTTFNTDVISEQWRASVNEIIK